VYGVAHAWAATMLAGDRSSCAAEVRPGIAATAARPKATARMRDPVVWVVVLDVLGRGFIFVCSKLGE
jgi:hypothetical protein